jgi:hypothetical protein
VAVPCFRPSCPVAQTSLGRSRDRPRKTANRLAQTLACIYAEPLAIDMPGRTAYLLTIVSKGLCVLGR